MLFAEDLGLWQIVRDGGPFVVAFIALIIGVITFWRIVGKPSLDALLTISANFARASDKLEHNTNRLEAVAAKMEQHHCSE